MSQNLDEGRGELVRALTLLQESQRTRCSRVPSSMSWPEHRAGPLAAHNSVIPGQQRCCSPPAVIQTDAFPHIKLLWPAGVEERPLPVKCHTSA